jgi:hypothetical protein
MGMLYEPIKRHNLVFVEEMIKNYVSFMGKYYGDCAYDFTIHAHLHLVKQVEKHGLLKTHSQLFFEVNSFFNHSFLLIFKIILKFKAH